LILFELNADAHVFLLILASMFQWTFLNDDFVPASDAVVPITDLSILRGYAVFDFLRFHHLTPLHLNEHVERLISSAGALGLEPGRSAGEIKELVVELIRKNNVEHGGIRITVTGGSSEDGYIPAKPLLIISQHHFNDVSDEQFKKGISLISHEYQRQLPHIKAIDYLMGIQMLPEIKKQKADDVLYHKSGIVSECPRANIFMVTSDQRICTPSAGILNGITRKKLMDLASSEYSIEQRNISLEELYTAEEIFITSTTKVILPVNAVDGKAAGNNGFPVCTHLLKLYREKYSIPS
jgi:branched-chain amino acid aminotransferase